VASARATRAQDAALASLAEARRNELAHKNSVRELEEGAAGELCVCGVCVCGVCECVVA